MNKRKSRREVSSFTACLIVLVVLLVCGWVTIKVTAWSEQKTYAYSDTVGYVVEQGDTLWTIARRYSTERHDVRKVIDIIEEINDCTATIYPGDWLDIPVFDITLGA